MLEDVSAEQKEFVTYRLVSLFSLSFESFAQDELELSVEEAQVIMRGLDPKDIPYKLEHVITAPFCRRISSSLPFHQGRFSDGRHGVFYGAGEDTTAMAEIEYHIQKKVEKLNISMPAWERHYLAFTCEYSGKTIDLTLVIDNQEQLIHDDYSFCQDLGHEAYSGAADGFQAPSARVNGGICTPVFREQCLSNPEKRSRFTFCVRNGEVSVVRSNESED